MQNLEGVSRVKAREIYVAPEEMREDWDYRYLLAEILARMERQENEKQPEPEEAELR